MKYSADLNLNILNHGNDPTVMICNRNEVSDRKLGCNLEHECQVCMVSIVCQSTDTHASKTDCTGLE